MADAATAGKSPGYAKRSGYMVDLIASPRRVRVMVDGETIADSTHMMLMRETRHLPVYYFPLDDVRTDLMRRTDHATHCPFKGEASYWSLALGDREVENIMWSYEAPYDEKPELAGYGAFYWDRVDRWFEEDEEIFVHPRDPHKRIDTVPSSRPVRVVVGGEMVAETTRAQPGPSRTRRSRRAPGLHGRPDRLAQARPRHGRQRGHRRFDAHDADARDPASAGLLFPARRCPYGPDATHRSRNALSVQG